jgi:hypothetical protein
MLEEAIGHIIQPIVDDRLRFKKLWKEIEEQIIKPKQQQSKSILADMYTPQIVTSLLAVPVAERVVLAQRLRAWAIHEITGEQDQLFQADWERLSSFVQSRIENGFPGFVLARAGLLKVFQTIDGVNAYYQQLKSAKFPRPDFPGKAYVHPRLFEQLSLALALLKERAVNVSLLPLNRVGGFEIRENRNHTEEISEHSFGFAIDIDAAMNPNIKVSKQSLFPRLVAIVTGTDIYAGAAVQAIRGGALGSALIAHIDELRAASTRFTEAFKGQDKLFAALFSHLPGGSALSAPQRAELETAVVTARGDRGRRAVRELLLQVQTGLDMRQAEADAQLLIYAYEIFRELEKKGDLLKPSPQATPVQIAKYGFLNLPAELVAALIDPSGGDLNWLGDQGPGKAKDFMHFELKDKPSLP